MGQERVVIVESRPRIRDVLIDLIQLEGMTAIGVETGHDALAQARADHPDLMLVSLNLFGEMDGIDTLIAVRRDAQLTWLPVVLLIDHFAGGELPQVGDEKLVVLKMADLDHLVAAINCLLLSSKYDESVGSAAI